MDPNPKRFPIVSYVLSRLKSDGRDSSPVDPDIEQLLPPSDHDRTALEMMPRLTQPEVLASMSDAVSEVARLRSLLQVLGDRPDHEAVDAARAKIEESEAELSRRLEEIVLSQRPEAERELEGMHAEYEELLRQAEERLVKIYRSVDGAGVGAGEGVEEKVEVNEEVVEILRDGSAQIVWKGWSFRGGN
ncbi:hypothetical protein QJS10_CPB04g01490 [Acorus calamus]|uniref:Uncharacterized protein n=1 Tax=Acorus calamus TaxID=4465 RepID=A0AAV9F3B2_ACOCL|nr:hypothetical protein QJS10_CPB04g01490 [Acorus calamus]